METACWTVPSILEPAHIETAAKVLATYFHDDGFPDFSGSRFERYAGGGDRPEIANTITPEDLVAVSLLSVDIKGHSALRLLGDRDPHHAEQISSLLAQLPTTTELVDATDMHIGIANQLWKVIRQDCKVGPTRTSKLLARKRPHLLPVIDSVVRRELGHTTRHGDFYATLRSHLRDNNQALSTHLREVRDKARIGDDISIIRCFDVLAWMIGSGRYTLDTDIRVVPSNC
jgi:Family of unknown function (DUF6308)